MTNDTDRYIASQHAGRHVVLDRSWLKERIHSNHRTSDAAQAVADQLNTPAPRHPQRAQQGALFDEQEATT